MSGALSPQDVLDWKPEALSTAAAAIGSRLKTFENGYDEFVGQRKILNEEWDGRANDGAQSSFSSEATSFSDLNDVLRQRQQVLEAGSSSLGEAKTLVQAAIMDAEASGLKVDLGSGAVTVPDSMLFPNATITQARHAQDLASQHAHEITAALNKAMAADRAVTNQLLGTSVEEAEMSTAIGGMDFRGYNLGANLHPGSQREWAMAMGLSFSLCSFPAAGVAIVGGMPGAKAGTGYYGGGFVVGPDGQKYPLVMPEVNRNGHVYNNNGPTDNSIMSLGNRDRHWVTRGMTSGVFSYGPKTGLLSKILAGTAIAFGAPVPAAMLVKRNDLLKYIRADPESEQMNFDYLAEPHQLGAPDGRQPSVPYDDSDPRLEQYVNRDAAGPYTFGLDSGINIANGIHTAAHMDDNRTHGYTVVFQQAPDGRRRAILKTLDVYTTPDGGQTQVRTGYAWIAPDGELKAYPLHEPPQPAHHNTTEPIS